MASGQNRFPEFQASRADSATYPLNLLQTELFDHELEAYQKRLGTDESAIFHSRHRSLYLLDYLENTKRFSLSPKLIDADQLLQNSLNEHSKDPQCRYMFIHARYSRDPLSISKQQLLYALTHLQAMPKFLNHVFTFCRREDPHLQATFAHEDHLTEQVLKIDELGRSGLQIQHCFNLIGVEYEKKEEQWPWLIRQTAVHFSFDLVGGQSSWIVLKANGVIRERLVRDLDGSSSRRRQDDISTGEGSLSLALRSHLLIFGWCIEKWSSYIDFLEKVAARPSALTKSGSVVESTSDEAISALTGSQPPTHSRQATGLSHQGPVSRSTSFREFLGFPQKSASSPPPVPTTIDKANYLNIEQLFSFDQLQAIHRDVSRLEEASGAIAQDKSVIEDIIRRFECLQKSAAFTSRVNVDLVDFGRFFEQARACIRELNDQQSRARATISNLDKVMSLFTGILQYKNMRTGEYFARQARQSTQTMQLLTQDMHDVATKTKQETVSMHSITVLTLFFLPGTFVATFFSTGILAFDDNDIPTVSIAAGHALGGWAFKPSALRLFLAICLPLMIFVLVLWGLAYFWARRKQRLAAAQVGAYSTFEEEKQKQGTATV